MWVSQRSPIPAKLPCVAALGRMPEKQSSSSSELSSLLLFKTCFIFSKLTKVSLSGLTVARTCPALKSVQREDRTFGDEFTFSWVTAWVTELLALALAEAAPLPELVETLLPRSDCCVS